MSDQLEWRERLEGAHKQMQEAMTELITNKNYSEVERLLHVADKSRIWVGPSSDQVYGREIIPSTRRRTRGRRGLAVMTRQDRAELQVAAVIGAVLGGGTGYLISDLAGIGGWPKILIWALIGAVVVTGIVFCLRGFRS